MVKVLVVMAAGALRDALSSRFHGRFEPLAWDVAESASAALTRLEHNSPDLIVSAADLGDLSGLEFLRRVRTDVARRELPVILLDETVLDTFSPSPSETVLERRAHPAVVAASAQALLSRNRAGGAGSHWGASGEPGGLDEPGAPTRAVGVGGSLEALPLFDLVFALAQKRTTGRLHLCFPDLRAQLFFEVGQVVHAECGARTGEAAVGHIFLTAERCRRGSFVYELTEEMLPLPSRTLYAPVQELLLRVAIKLDHQRIVV